MSKRKLIRKAKQELDILKLSDEERLAYERYRDDLHYQASMVESSYTIGLRKGEKKGKAEVAIKLLASGSLGIESIAEMTGLSIKKLRKLKQEHGLIK